MERTSAHRKVAVTVWDERISPVFDSARTLLIAEIGGQDVVYTMQLVFDPERVVELVQMLRSQQVTLLICGAVSARPAAMLEAGGIELAPFVAGEVRRVLACYARGGAWDAEFRMPGCGRGVCCRGKIRRGWAIGPLRNGESRGGPRRAEKIGLLDEGVLERGESPDLSRKD